jgi:hypothetical protein
MTQPDLFPVSTYRDRVADLLLSRKGQWIDGMEIAQRGGIYGWRTRISECRTQLGLTVENQQRRVVRRVVSEYRVV